MAARFFNANGAVNALLPPDVPRAPREAEYVADFLGQWYNPGSGDPSKPYYNWGEPWINGVGTPTQQKQFAVPTIVVPHSTPRIPVSFRDPWATAPNPVYPRSAQFPAAQDGYWPDELSWRLQQGVPIPQSILTDPDYKEATWMGGVPGNFDAGLAIIDDTTHELWEFWVFIVLNDGTPVCGHAGWMPDHTQNGGVFQNVASPFQSNQWGSSATSISIAGAQISQQELVDGVIPHAIGVDLMGAAEWWDIVWPAERGDGQGWSPIPEGTRLRLEPAFDITTINAGNPAATRTARSIAKAMQDHGWLVWDKGGAIALQVEPDVYGTGFDWNGGLYPNALLKSIPLSSSNLQVVDPAWRPGAPPPPPPPPRTAGWRVSVAVS